MYITSREKDIIELIIKSAGRYTTYSIAKFLHVSTRTVQRDLKAVEKILAKYDLELARNADKGLSIVGANQQIFRLVQTLAGTKTVDQTPEERKLLLFIALLENESCKTQVLANQLGVSITTLSTYLDELNDWLHPFRLQINRRRGVGVELVGSEMSKRRALARYYLDFFYELILEELFTLGKTKETKPKILYYFETTYFVSIDKVLHQVLYEQKLELADHDFAGVMIHICIAMQRTEMGYALHADDRRIEEIGNESTIIKEVCKRLEREHPITLSQVDQSVLAIILKGSKLQATDDLFYERADLNRLVTHLIQFVSTELHVDLTKDFSLHQGLLAHLGPSLFRLKQNMGLFNPLKDEIKQKYPVLFLAVTHFFETECTEIEDFPEDELAFIVLHFGSALVIWEEQFRLRALLICPSGIGTSKMLASRIKKEFIEIATVDTLSLKEVQQAELSQYDLILSTVRLPFIDVQYLFVSPLLYEEDIERIKLFLEQNVKKFTRNREYTQISTRAKRNQRKSLKEVLAEMKHVYESVDQLQTNFSVFHSSDPSYKEILKQMVIQAEKDGILHTASQVLHALYEREKKGGLGIPGTELSLFHCRHKDIQQLLFQITYLETPVQIKGMDGKDMFVRSILLLLAPEGLHQKQLELISLISASLIDSPEAIYAYSSGNEHVIKERLEMLMLDFIQVDHS